MAASLASVQKHPVLKYPQTLLHFMQKNICFLINVLFSVLFDATNVKRASRHTKLGEW